MIENHRAKTRHIEQCSQQKPNDHANNRACCTHKRRFENKQLNNKSVQGTHTFHGANLAEPLGNRHQHSIGNTHQTHEQ